MHLHLLEKYGHQYSQYPNVLNNECNKDIYIFMISLLGEVCFAKSTSGMFEGIRQN